MITTLVAYIAEVLECREGLWPGAPPTIIATGCSDPLYIVGAFANQDSRYYILVQLQFVPLTILVALRSHETTIIAPLVLFANQGGGGLLLDLLRVHKIL